MPLRSSTCVQERVQAGGRICSTLGGSCFCGPVDSNVATCMGTASDSHVQHFTSTTSHIWHIAVANTEQQPVNHNVTSDGQHRCSVNVAVPVQLVGAS
jgi:hypothetical protein